MWDGERRVTLLQEQVRLLLNLTPTMFFVLRLSLSGDSFRNHATYTQTTRSSTQRADIVCTNTQR